MLVIQLTCGFPIGLIANLLLAMAIAATARLVWRFTA